MTNQSTPIKYMPATDKAMPLTARSRAASLPTLAVTVDHPYRKGRHTEKNCCNA